MARFIEINEKNLTTIAELNEGVTPQIEVPPTYFLTWTHDTLVNEIVTSLQIATIERLMPPELITIER